MKVFVFGAGASKGSQEESPHGGHLEAPLVDELFVQVYWRGPAFLHNDELAECRQGALECGGSVERWLTERWERVESLKEERSKSAEKAFFGRLTCHLWLLLQGVSDSYTLASGYYQFLKRLRLKDEPFALVSFNYDTLLDQAVQDCYGTPLLALRDYLSFGLIKPHGSVNWLLPRRDADPRIRGMARNDDVRARTATSMLFNGPPHLVDRVVVLPPRVSSGTLRELLDGTDDDYSYPLLFMPLTTKLYTTVSAFYETVIAKANELLAQASQVYLVGYRAADDIIKEMFQRVAPGTPLHVVGRGRAGDVMKSVLSWATHLSQGEICDTGFMEFAKAY